MIREREGFTLIEIMIVIAIIGILAAFAVPNLLRARMDTNDRAVQQDIRAFSTAAENFRSAQNPPAYPADIQALTGAAPFYLDTSWDDDPLRKHAHTLVYQTAGANTFSISAQAMTLQSAAHFCIDQTGVLMMSTAGAMPAADGSGCTGGGWAAVGT